VVSFRFGMYMVFRLGIFELFGVPSRNYCNGGVSLCWVLSQSIIETTQYRQRVK